MSSLAPLTEQLRSRQDLSVEQVAVAARDLAASEINEAEKVAFLLALADKGESPAEVAAFATAFRSVSIDPGVQAWAPQAIDIVGTGGDHAGGFNVSSLVVLVLACAGVPVMKHGNRGVTSKCGSADLFTVMGFDLSAPPAKLQEAIKQLGYVFFFAPNYHPAFRHIAPVRKALAAQGRRTVFNILGPLINPGRPANILLGVYSTAWVEKLAHALTELGAESGLAVHGVIDEGRGIDELTTATANLVHGIGRLGYISDTWRATDFGLEMSPFTDLVGGDIETNLALVEAVLDGRGPRGLVDTIVLNAAVGLRIASRIGNIQEGLVPCRELLLGGAVRARIAATREFFRP